MLSTDTQNTENHIFSELIPDSQVDLLLENVGANYPKVLAQGMYWVVLSYETSEDLVLKVLRNDPRVHAALEAGAARYGEYSVGLKLESLILDSLGNNNETLYKELIQLALQHEIHLKYLGRHVLPKKFGIVSFQAPILGKLVSEDFKENFLKKTMSQKSELIFITPEMHGRIVEISFKHGGSKQYFQRYKLNKPTNELYSIEVSTGYHIVEVQKKLYFTTEGTDSKFICHGVLDYINKLNTIGKWDEPFLDELFSFISCLVDMLIAGVSIDSAYSKVSQANIVVMKDPDHVRIVTYDTNNFEVSMRYIDKNRGDPYLGLKRDFVDEKLLNKLIIPLINEVTKAQKNQYINDDLFILFLNKIQARLNEVSTIDIDLLTKKIDSTSQEIEKIQKKILSSMRKKETSETNELIAQLGILEQEIKSERSLPELARFIKKILVSLGQSYI